MPYMPSLPRLWSLEYADSSLRYVPCAQSDYVHLELAITCHSLTTSFVLLLDQHLCVMGVQGAVGETCKVHSAPSEGIPYFAT